MLSVEKLNFHLSLKVIWLVSLGMKNQFEGFLLPPLVPAHQGALSTTVSRFAVTCCFLLLAPWPPEEAASASPASPVKCLHLQYLLVIRPGKTSTWFEDPVQTENGGPLFQNPWEVQEGKSRAPTQEQGPSGHEALCSCTAGVPMKPALVPGGSVAHSPGSSSLPCPPGATTSQWEHSGLFPHTETSERLCDMVCLPEELCGESSEPLPACSTPCSHPRLTWGHSSKGDVYAALSWASSSGHAGLWSHHNHCHPAPPPPPFSRSRQCPSPPNLFSCHPSKPGMPFPVMEILSSPSLSWRTHPHVTAYIFSTPCLLKGSSLLQILKVAFDT